MGVRAVWDVTPDRAACNNRKENGMHMPPLLVELLERLILVALKLFQDYY
jgi:hypothetical protein